MQNVIRARKVNGGATIGVFTPSEPIVSRRLPRVEAGMEYLRGVGYKVVPAENYTKTFFYMGGTVEERIEDIHSLLRRDDVDVLMSSWGGKSCNQLLPHIDYDLIQSKRKPVIGFSDGTCLANAIFAKTGLITFLGPNIMGKLDESDHSDLIFLREPCDRATIFMENDISSTLCRGKCRGRLLGGTITSFVLGVLHSEFEPDLRGAIFVLDAGSKSPQLLDQLLTFTQNSNKLNDIAGLIICNLDQSKDEKDWGGRPSIDVILEKFSGLRIPIIHTPAFGHGKQKNPILPIGALCELDANRGVLEVVEQVVE